MDLGHAPLYTLVEKLARGEIVLPDIQRDYVWSGSQIPRLLDSLNKEWPVGSVLLWTTGLSIPTKTAAVVQGAPAAGNPSILLDGQQRLSTIARVMLPDAIPPGEKAPDVRYHPGLGEFRTANAIQKQDKQWIAVSEILRSGAQFRELVKPLDVDQAQEDAWTDVLAGVARRIREYSVPVQTIHVDDYETVAEIFNRVNTGGTRLSKGDLVLGSMAARWAGGRDAIETFEAEMRATGWAVNREVLLRILSVLALNSPNHIRLLDLKTEQDWTAGWTAATSAVRSAVGFLKDDARILTRSLLPTEYVLLLPAVFLHDFTSAFEPGEADELSRWVYLASAFGHYSGSLETRLAADVNLLRDPALKADRPALMRALTRTAQEPRTPGTRITEEDIRGKKHRSPLLRLLQLLATQNAAKSWLSNRAITFDPQHNGLSVEVHHIFPRAWLKNNGLGDNPEGDAMANFAFLSKWDNIRIGADDPATYLAKADPDALAAQWIPTDPDLWTAARFDDFCAARRALIAGALSDRLGLDEAHASQPLEADETPEPEVGSWSQDVDLQAAVP
ncbi:MAG: GmrSD restriction endonuclease domain-containing protein [Solirubrobacteraceae bacterium]